MNDLIGRYQQVKQRVITAAQQAQRCGQVELLAVSKKHSVEKIKVLVAAGQQSFGESYVQEGVEKISQLEDPALVWHFIGPIQSNKAKLIAKHFDWVHSVDRFKILKFLHQSRDKKKPPLNVLIQINIGGEHSKSGASYNEVLGLAEATQEFNHLTLRGLMCIPPPSDDFQDQCAYFEEARLVFDELANKYTAVDTLSMGMSGDLEAAIQTGSTVVRIGTDIFGPRLN